jgi:hypothetical protein
VALSFKDQTGAKELILNPCGEIPKNDLYFLYDRMCCTLETVISALLFESERRVVFEAIAVDSNAHQDLCCYEEHPKHSCEPMFLSSNKQKIVRSWSMRMKSAWAWHRTTS